MVEKASIEDVMKVLVASRKQELPQLWNTCSHLVAKSGLPPEILSKHLPIEVVSKIEEIRLKSSVSRRSLISSHHHHPHDLAAATDLEDQKIRRMRRALDSSDVELVKLMVMGEGLNLDEALALHYAVENCSREVVKALLELGAADVNFLAGPAGKTPLHVAAEMVSPDMVSVLLDHHADPTARTIDGITPLDVLRTLTTDFLFKGAIPGLAHVEPNKLRLCLELVQSAAMVISREEENASSSSGGAAAINYPTMSSGNIQIDTRMVYLNLGATGPSQIGSRVENDNTSPCTQGEAILNRQGSQSPMDPSIGNLTRRRLEPPICDPSTKVNGDFGGGVGTPIGCPSPIIDRGLRVEVLDRFAGWGHQPLHRGLRRPPWIPVTFVTRSPQSI
ncbi:hypothetical protein CRG98_047000 [Punica granatum]|uniref:Regulatory protein NPR central domain-containing protein n=1 Tax=Punica granatum TaxID=22663 RepID=A0A2I0HLZ1_PUNGR|nr:hypothetical protein CRG98_047000 [Punica granatum]